MPKLVEIINCIESFAPISYQESYDNSGLAIGTLETDITGILTALDINESVIDEAINTGCNLIVAHHPIIFHPIKKLINQNTLEKNLIKAIQNNISIYIAHTNLDNVIEGVSGSIGTILKLKKIRILKDKTPTGYIDKQNSTFPTIGSGIIGELQKPLSEIEFLEYIKDTLKLTVIKHSIIKNVTINKIAVCGGSGSGLLSNAIAKSADAMITSDIKYHTFFDTGNDIFITDIGHYESEVHTKRLLKTILLPFFTNTKILESKINTNPISYFK